MSWEMRFAVIVIGLILGQIMETLREIRLLLEAERARKENA
jgi:hypothetical protein